VFGEKGWAGMTMDEVAARARVGKSSLYLRWPDKAVLLTQALSEAQRGLRDDADADTDTDADTADAIPEPSLRDYLVAHAVRRAELYLGDFGLAMLRLYAEARAHPDLFVDIREKALTQFVIEERHRVEAAIRAGELPATASPVRILDAVEGAIFMHVLVTPPALVERVRSGIPQYVEQMVDDQLRAAGCPGAVSPPGS
jgi:AcrR family transcriptional regulator